MLDVIRIIHMLGGCGGTLLSRCLGVLPGVALLSEINPGSVKLFPHFDPLYQDRNWLHLLQPTDIERFSQMDIGITANFRDLLQQFHRCASASSRHLVLRDYNYLDFVGVPYLTDPPRRLIVYDALPHEVSTASVAFIRHPVDQWVSLCKHEHVRAVLTPSVFCAAYAAFLQQLGSTRIYKYEDFIERSEVEFEAICRDLALPFEPSFLRRFHAFDSVTGDFARQDEPSISAPAKKPIAPAAMDEFRSSQDYGFILSTAGYPGESTKSD